MGTEATRPFRACVQLYFVFFTEQAFAGVETGGLLVTWGDGTFGGNSTCISTQLTGGVKAIFSTSAAFAAVKNNGSVVTWGNSEHELWPRAQRDLSILMAGQATL